MYVTDRVGLRHVAGTGGFERSCFRTGMAFLAIEVLRLDRVGFRVCGWRGLRKKNEAEEQKGEEEEEDDGGGMVRSFVSEFHW
jgi:hypothetical protein